MPPSLRPYLGFNSHKLQSFHNKNLQHISNFPTTNHTKAPYTTPPCVIPLVFFFRTLSRTHLVLTFRSSSYGPTCKSWGPTSLRVWPTIWARVDQLLVLGMGNLQPLIGNPYNGYINLYYWVDDHPLLYGNLGSLDPSTYGKKQSTWMRWRKRRGISGETLLKVGSAWKNLLDFCLINNKQHTQDGFLNLDLIGKGETSKTSSAKRLNYHQRNPQRNILLMDLRLFPWPHSGTKNS